MPKRAKKRGMTDYYSHMYEKERGIKPMWALFDAIASH